MNRKQYEVGLINFTSGRLKGAKQFKSNVDGSVVWAFLILGVYTLATDISSTGNTYNCKVEGLEEGIAFEVDRQEPAPEAGDIIIIDEDMRGELINPVSFKGEYFFLGETENISKTGVEVEQGAEEAKGSLKGGKTFHNTDASGAKVNVKDIKFWGDGDTFKLISKASSKEEGWMKSTKAMEVVGVGCVVQVTTQQDKNVAEALVFVPNTKIKEKVDENGNVIARKLVQL